MHEIIISDTSSLILLSKINQLSLLTMMYEEIAITDIVAEEYGQPLPDFIRIKKLQDYSKYLIFEREIDSGEASSLALALEIPNSTLLLDDKKARKVAFRYNLPFTGLLGVFVQAKKIRKITAIKPYLESLKISGMWISENLYQTILQESDEV